MVHIARRWLLLLAAAMLSGCATAPFMPLSDPASKQELAQPIYLLKVVVKNGYKERWQPRVLSVVLSKDGAAGKRELRAYRMDDKGAVAGKGENALTTYLVRIPGTDSFNTINGLNAIASAFPINGFYFVPLYATLGSDGPGVYYLGSVQATIRERKDNEFRAGPPIPLIDQAVAGASTGTFDIDYADNFDEDSALFKSAFPALRDVNIVKKLLPPWDRSRAQKEWEGS